MGPLPRLATFTETVVVFQRGARVTRAGTVRRDGPDWPSELLIDALPLTLIDASLEVAIDSADGNGPIAIAARVVVGAREAALAMLTPDRAELEAATLKLAHAAQRMSDLEAAQHRVEQLDVVPRPRPKYGDLPAPSPLAGRLAMVAFREQRLRKLAEQTAEASEVLRSAQERVATLEERVRRASNAAAARETELCKQVILRLEPPTSASTATCEATVRVSYQVPGARWAPAYALSLDSAAATGRLEVRAVVGQATGEDWRGAALRLSTARPQRWTELPRLQALRIGRRQPRTPRLGWRSPPPSTEALFEDYDRSFPRVPPGAKAAITAKRASGAPAPGIASGVMPPAAPEALQDWAAAAADALSLPAEPLRARAASGPPVLSAPAPFAMPAPAMMAAERGPARRMPAPQVAEPPPPSALEPSDRLLDYANLVMPSPAAPDRGQLRPPRADESAGPIDVPPSVIERAVTRARREATRAEERPLPPGHRDPAGGPTFDYVYVADGAMEIPSDGVFHGISLLQTPLQVEPRVVVVPRESRDAFRQVAFVNPLDAPLLEGPVDVAIDGRFALTSQVTTTPPRGRLELGLGVDPAIKVARNVAFEDVSAGVLVRSRSLRHRISLEASNRHPHDVQLEIRERIPHAVDNGGVEVEVEHVDPPWVDYHQNKTLRSGYAWHLTIGPGKTAHVHYTYTLRVAAGSTVVGGDRRET